MVMSSTNQFYSNRKKKREKKRIEPASAETKGSLDLKEVCFFRFLCICDDKVFKISAFTDLFIPKYYIFKERKIDQATLLWSVLFYSE